MAVIEVEPMEPPYEELLKTQLSGVKFIAFTKEAYADAEAIMRETVKEAGPIKSAIGRLINGIPPSKEQFNNEGPHQYQERPALSIRVYAIKAHQLRLYCVETNLGGPCFLVLRACKKKKNKADPMELSRTARLYGEFKTRQQRSNPQLPRQRLN